MLRKIIFTTVILASIAAIGWYLYNLENVTAKPQEIVEQSSFAIPKDAVVLLECNNMVEAWRELKNGNLIYEELSTLPDMASWDQVFTVLDSTAFEDQEWKNLLQKNRVYLSWHPLGESTKVLWSQTLKAPLNSVKNKVKTIFNLESDFEKKQYENVEILGFTYRDSPWFFAIHKDVLMLSNAIITVEKAIQTLNAGSHLLVDNDFKSIKKLTKDRANVQLYFQAEKLPEIWKSSLDGFDQRILNNQFGAWSQLDVTVSANNLLLNGFAISSDSTKSILNCFKGQDPVEIEIVEVMPSNMAWFMHFGITDAQEFDKQTELYWHLQGEDIHENRTQFQGRYGLNTDLFYAQFGQELALGVLEPNSTDLQEDYCLFAAINDQDEANELMKSWYDSLATQEDLKVKQSTYRGYQYWDLGELKMAEALFGPLFYMIDNPVITTFEDYLVMANSQRTLKTVINRYKSDQTLSKDIHYAQFMDDMSSESNVTFYSNIARAPYYYQHLMGKQTNLNLGENMDVFRQFQAFCVQYEQSDEDIFYQTIFCKHNPIYKKETNSLWELSLDTASSGTPHLVKNHYTEQQELLIQDDRNDLYLVSNTGKLLWKLKFDEKIKGEVIQIDKYKNNKLQMLFATKNHIHLLDRNGKVVEGFPVKLPSKASSDLAVFDYDNNGKIRLLIGCEDNQVYNYDLNGKQVQGWEYAATESPLNDRIQHFKIGDKDYLLASHSDGSTRLLDRKGQVRHPINSDVETFGSKKLVARKNIEDSYFLYLDSINRLNRFTFNGTNELVTEDEMEVAQLKSDDEELYVLGQNGDEIFIYNIKGEQVAELETESSLSNVRIHPQDGDILVSGTSEDGLVYLYGKNGDLQKGFPLVGTGPSVLSNINNDPAKELIVTGENGMIYTYMRSN